MTKTVDTYAHSKRLIRTRDVLHAQREGDYGAVARGYGFIVKHCECCPQSPDHAGMTCHWIEAAK